MNIDIFDGINNNLSNLNKITKSAIIEVIFSFRDSVETVCVVFKSFDIFSKLVGNVPEKIVRDYHDGKANKFYVDLESLHTNKMRLYTNYKEPGVQLIGYYVNTNGSIYETKVYNDTSLTSVKIKRYDSEMKLIDDQETENIVELSEWAGSKEIINIAVKHSLSVKCVKKTIKNQNYLLVSD
jgi:hypothetical protein